MNALHFAHLWARYQYNRTVAFELVKPDVNRCAIVMSLTLKKHPNAVAKSLGDFPKLVDDAHRSDPRLRLVYVSSQQLALRLQGDWGKPLRFRTHPRQALEMISGRNGVVYFHHAYAGNVGHIDLFDGKMIACKFSLDGSDHLVGPDDPFVLAHEIWFWGADKIKLG